jgi:hypothetical protein
MPVRRVSFKKTHIEVSCKVCGNLIKIGSECVTLVAFTEGITYKIEGISFNDGFLDGEVYQLVLRKIRGQAPLVKIELACTEGYPIFLKKPPIVTHAHREGCGIDNGPVVKQLVDGSYGSRHG